MYGKSQCSLSKLLDNCRDPAAGCDCNAVLRLLLKDCEHPFVSRDETASILWQVMYKAAVQLMSFGK